MRIVSIWSWSIMQTPLRNFLTNDKNRKLFLLFFGVPRIFQNITLYNIVFVLVCRKTFIQKHDFSPHTSEPFPWNRKARWSSFWPPWAPSSAAVSALRKRLLHMASTQRSLGTSKLRWKIFGESLCNASSQVVKPQLSPPRLLVCPPPSPRLLCINGAGESDFRNSSTLCLWSLDPRWSEAEGGEISVEVEFSLNL